VKPIFSMREALESNDVLGLSLPGPSWRNWRSLLIASRGEPLTAEERETFEELTSRPREPDEPADEFWAVVGRGGGKTAALSTAAAYYAGCIDHTGRAKAGQRLRLPVMAVSKEAAAEAFNYLKGIFTEFPFFAELVDGEPTASRITLTNTVDIMVTAASFRTVRGPTLVACLCDELAFWSIEGQANPDREILRAIRPGLARYGDGAPLLVLSSPYAKKGELWETFKKQFRPEGNPRIVVVRAPTLTMHDTAALRRQVERAYEEDPESAKAEWGAEFRDGVSDFVSTEVVDRCTDRGVTEREPEDGVRYVAFIDPAGGSGKDSMTLAVAHSERDGSVILDLVVGIRPPFSPDASCAQFAATLRGYGVREVTGDNWGNEWPRELLRKHRIGYVKSEKTKATIYSEFLPVLNSGKVRLLDHEPMRRELLNLERRTAFGGKDSIDHPSNGHDDLINAAAGAITLAKTEVQRIVFTSEMVEQLKQLKRPSRPHHQMFARRRF
jgi:hypothetical protein